VKKIKDENKPPQKKIKEKLYSVGKRKKPRAEKRKVKLTRRGEENQISLSLAHIVVRLEKPGWLL
jgi:hypothetical protein